MKLLSPTEIQKEKNSERKLQVDEGIRIAKRIDKLRETLGDEEKKLYLFRTQTVTAITEEIAKMQEQLDTLRSEVAILREQKRDALKPIVEEMKSLEAMRVEIEDQEDKIYDKFQDLNKQEQRLKEFYNALEKKNSLLKQAEVRARDLYLQSKKKDNESQKILADVQQSQRAFEENKERILKTLENKERILDYDRKHFKDFEETLRKKERELEIRERRITVKENANNRSKR